MQMSYKCNKRNNNFAKPTNKPISRNRHKNTIFDNEISKWYNTPKWVKRVWDNMICQDDISNIKTELDENIGRKVIIKGAMGRKRFFEEEAIIEKTYPNIFIVKNQEKETNASYRYTDILTNELQVSIFNGVDYAPLVPAELRSKF